MSTRFTLFNRQLVISNATTGETQWAGRINDAKVEAVVALEDLDAAVVLLDPEAFDGPARNLVCVNPDGQLRWRAFLPTSQRTDAYVDVDYDGRVLTANSWSGYQVVLDVASGSIVDKIFTK
jgi:outer membrane protein assembly factor BamB